MKTQLLLAGIIASILFFPVQGQTRNGSSNCSDQTETIFASGLSPSRQYAAEILSFLLEIVLGQEGSPRYRKEWAARGADESLDYTRIAKTMSDSDTGQLDLIVLDPGLHFLTRVLYRYDNRLSQYKGRFDFAAIYPATEIVALRLLLLKKINKGEKINLEELIRLENLLLHSEGKISEEDLKAVNLNADEMQFLRDILADDPRLFEYLKSPFLVRGLVRAGAVVENAFARERIAMAGYRGCCCSWFSGSKRRDAVKIAVLPSIIGEFEHDADLPGLSPFGFKPTEDLLKRIKKLETDILCRTSQLLEKEAVSGFSAEERKENGNAAWNDRLQKYLAFYVEDKRPLLITPNNAEEVLSEVCPEADFTIILLDKNVYLTLNLTEKDVYPAVPWLYLDIMDIDYSQAGNEMEEISRYLCSRLLEKFHCGDCGE